MVGNLRRHTRHSKIALDGTAPPRVAGQGLGELGSCIPWVGGRCRSPEHQPRETAMSPQRARMIEDMILAGLAAGDAARLPPGGPAAGRVLPSLAGPAQRRRCPGLPARPAPARRGARDVPDRPYGLRFLFRETLGRDWALFGEKKHRLPRQKRLPDVAAGRSGPPPSRPIRNPVHRTCFALMYACGLRICEATTLEVDAIDRAPWSCVLSARATRSGWCRCPSRFSTIWSRVAGPSQPPLAVPQPPRRRADQPSRAVAGPSPQAAAAAGFLPRVTPHALRHLTRRD